jgi:hypothetical protein
METWGMPTSLILAVRYADKPSDSPSEREALMAICYANAIVDKFANDAGEHTYSSWSYTVQIADDVQAEVGLEAEEFDMVFPKLLEQVEFYLPTKLMAEPMYIKGRRVS